jgi:sigma-B regulation protein RsbU (phosphoserine phosphatase)
VRGLAQELRPVARDPGEFMTKLNRGLTGILRQTRLPIFASAFYLVADTAAGEVRFASAGHPAPFHVRTVTGTVELLKAPPGTRRGAALGLLEESVYATSRVTVAVMDRVILFTDGLFEIESAGDELYDEKRLLDAVRRRATLPLEALFSDLLAELQQFSGSGHFDDDVCLVGVEIERIGVATPGSPTL